MPFSNSTTLEFKNDKNESYNLSIIDLNGQIVRQINNIKENRLIIKKENLNAGLYYFILRNDKEIINKGKLLID